MKRYVKEFAADEIRNLNWMPIDYVERYTKRYQDIVSQCERGYLSEREAVCEIYNTHIDMNDEWWGAHKKEA